MRMFGGKIWECALNNSKILLFTLCLNELGENKNSFSSFFQKILLFSKT